MLIYNEITDEERAVLDDYRKRKDRWAKKAFLPWLEQTAPGIIDGGEWIIWRGCAPVMPGDEWKNEAGYRPWYRIAVHTLVGMKFAIEVSSSNMECAYWLEQHKNAIKRKLVWYCKAVLDLCANADIRQIFYHEREDELEWEEPHMMSIMGEEFELLKDTLKKDADGWMNCSQ